MDKILEHTPLEFLGILTLSLSPGWVNSPPYGVDYSINYGDVKPRNLLLSFNNMNLPEIVLCDYGTAGPDGSMYPGTRPYMPLSTETPDSIDQDNLDTIGTGTTCHHVKKIPPRDNGIAKQACRKAFQKGGKKQTK